MLNGFTVLLDGESGAAEAEAGAATPAPAMTAASTSAAPSFFIFLLLIYLAYLDIWSIATYSEVFRPGRASCSNPSDKLILRR